MNRSKKRTPESIAREVIQHIETACGEIAYEAVEGENVTGLRIPDCPDPVGALADQLYGREDFLEDMLGDAVYDRTAGDKILRGQVLDYLIAHGQPALATVSRHKRNGYLMKMK